jgi:hypothetical protein
MEKNPQWFAPRGAFKRESGAAVGLAPQPEGAE